MDVEYLRAGIMCTCSGTLYGWHNLMRLDVVCVYLSMTLVRFVGGGADVRTGAADCGTDLEIGICPILTN